MPKEICAWAAEAEAKSSAESSAVCRSLFMIGGYCNGVTWICSRLHMQFHDMSDRVSEELNASGAVYRLLCRRRRTDYKSKMATLGRWCGGRDLGWLWMLMAPFLATDQTRLGFNRPDVVRS